MMKKILVLDNYDSFTYNLVHYIRELTNVKVDVFRNDMISIEDVKSYNVIVLSPGPGIPIEAGIMLDLIKKYAPAKKILGVCLGCQAIAEAFGGKLINLSKVYHGVATPIKVLKPKEVFFKNIPSSFNGGRYHSWIISKENFPKDFNVIAEDNKGYIMGVKHKKFDVTGVQFHPESVLTEHGKKMIQNWLEG